MLPVNLIEKTAIIAGIFFVFCIFLIIMISSISLGEMEKTFGTGDLGYMLIFLGGLALGVVSITFILLMRTLER
ncbi:MAG: hypothetical protein WC406_10795 [Methanoregula sp.]